VILGQFQNAGSTETFQNLGVRRCFPELGGVEGHADGTLDGARERFQVLSRGAYPYDGFERRLVHYMFIYIFV